MHTAAVIFGFLLVLNIWKFNDSNYGIKALVALSRLASTAYRRKGFSRCLFGRNSTRCVPNLLGRLAPLLPLLKFYPLKPAFHLCNLLLQTRELILHVAHQHPLQPRRLRTKSSSENPRSHCNPGSGQRLRSGYFRC